MKVFGFLKSQGGFTFLEVILTTLVMSVGFWGVLMIMQNASNNALTSDFRIMANQLASEKIEAVIADKTFRGFDYIVQDNYASETLSGAYAGFTRSVTITEVNSDDLSTPEPGSSAKKVDVTIVWGNEAHQTIQVSTVVNDYS